MEERYTNTMQEVPDPVIPGGNPARPFGFSEERRGRNAAPCTNACLPATAWKYGFRAKSYSQLHALERHPRMTRAPTTVLCLYTAR